MGSGQKISLCKDNYLKKLTLKLFTLLALFCVPTGAWAVYPPDNSSIIQDSRRIRWDPGVRGGVPTTYGADCTPSPLPTSSNAAAIQSALNLCSPATNSTCYVNGTCPVRVLKLAKGTFNINAALKIPSYVVLRGEGMRDNAADVGTELKGTSSFSGSVVLLFDNSFDESWSGGTKQLASPTKDSSTITTNSAHGWKAGDIVLIDMLEQVTGNLATGVPPIDNSGSLGNCTWCGRDGGKRPIGQWVKIVSAPTSTTATIDPPLYFSYPNTPEATKMTGLTHFAGAEDLTVNNLTSQRQDTVGIFGAINSWLKNVELMGNKRRAVWAFGGLWFTMQSCRVTGGIPIAADKTANYHSDRAYGPFFGPHFSAALITDSIFDKLTMGVAFEGAASGNVFSYNYIIDIWWEDTGDSPRRFGPLMHGPHPFMNLLEGNWSGGRIRHDEYWGTSSHFTYLRNRVIQVDRGSGDSQTWTVDIERKNWYTNFVGNVLGGGPGTDGVKEDRYELINGASAPYSENRSTIWKIGYKSLGSDGTLYDDKTLSTMLRWGNWTYIARNASDVGNIAWHAENITNTNDKVIPNSYYLSGAPSWFAGMTWPPYDPAVAASHDDTVPRLPAHKRYNYFCAQGLAKSPPVKGCPTVALAPTEPGQSAPTAPSNLKLNP